MSHPHGNRAREHEFEQRADSNVEVDSPMIPSHHCESRSLGDAESKGCQSAMDRDEKAGGGGDGGMIESERLAMELAK